MKPTIIFLFIAAQTFAGNLVIYEMPQPGEATEELTAIDRWDGQEKVEVGRKHLFSSDDIVRVLVTVHEIPAVTQEQIDEAVSKMSEDQRKKVASVWKPEPAKEMIRLSYVFANDATKRFKDITKTHINEKLAVVVGRKVVSSVTVRESISNGFLNVSCILKNADELSALFPQSDPKVFLEEVPKTEE